jgi:hypothetical protein
LHATWNSRAIHCSRHDQKLSPHPALYMHTHYGNAINHTIEPDLFPLYITTRFDLRSSDAGLRPDRQAMGLRHRALIGLLVFTFARISAALGMTVADVFWQHRRLWVGLHEKGGKEQAMPCHHNLETYLPTTSRPPASPATARAWFLGSEASREAKSVALSTPTDRGAVFKAVNQAHQHFGRLDVILSNAGYGLMGAVEEASLDDARANLGTNVLGICPRTAGSWPSMLVLACGRRAR